MDLFDCSKCTPFNPHVDPRDSGSLVTLVFIDHVELWGFKINKIPCCSNIALYCNKPGDILRIDQRIPDMTAAN